MKVRCISPSHSECNDVIGITKGLIALIVVICYVALTLLLTATFYSRDPLSEHALSSPLANVAVWQMIVRY